MDYGLAWVFCLLCLVPPAIAAVTVYLIVTENFRSADELMCSSTLCAFVSLPANFSHSRLLSPYSLRLWSLLGWSEFGQGVLTADVLLADLGWKLQIAFLVGTSV